MDRYNRLSTQFGNARLAVAGITVVAGWLVFAVHWFPAWTLAIPIAGFIAMVLVHDHLDRRRQRLERAAYFYERGLERLEGRWRGKGDCDETFLNDKHPYGLDLDIFGRGALFEMLCTSRTLAGRRMLAGWLLEPAPPEEVLARQKAIDELRDSLDLREDLAVMGEDVQRGVHAGSLPRWGEAAPLLDSKAARITAAIFPLVLLVALVLYTSHNWPATAFWLVAAAEGVFGLVLRRRVLLVAAAVDQPAHDLEILVEVLRRIENETFLSPRLIKLQEALKTDGHPPSRQIARLNRLVELVDSRDHLVVRLIGPPLLWTTQLAFAVEAWRKKTGPNLRQWLVAVGEFEALSSLAGYAYEHPDDPFAEIVEGPACFDGKGLGHPLIPESQSVRNDVKLDAGHQVLLVSGSNMSGKSTLLRTVGVNAVLAMAGAPVRARSLRMSQLAVGASIRVVDSLETGVSRFYAEITRIRQLMDMANSRHPLLFLLDELLHGTNSHDRRIGAEAIVKGLVERGALGLVTTHDLAVAHIADDLAPRIENVHFRDHLEDDQMKFDYTLHPGVVEHSNALALMRSVGLDV